MTKCYLLSFKKNFQNQFWEKQLHVIPVYRNRDIQIHRNVDSALLWVFDILMTSVIINYFWHFSLFLQYRSIRLKVFCIKVVLKNLAKFTERHLFQKLHRCFSVKFAKFAKFLRVPFHTEHLWWLLLAVTTEWSHLMSFCYLYFWLST